MKLETCPCLFARAPRAEAELLPGIPSGPEARYHRQLLRTRLGAGGGGHTGGVGDGRQLDATNGEVFNEDAKGRAVRFESKSLVERARMHAYPELAALPIENRWLFLLSVPGTEALEPLLVSWTFLAEDGVFGSLLPPSSWTRTRGEMKRAINGMTKFSPA